jgi:DNA polymerase/3'-5' exonuclease PolX
MSKTLERLAYPVAMKHASRIMNVIESVCERVRIAGSLRRRQMDVGDIEIVCIPVADGLLPDARSSLKIKTLLLKNGYRVEMGGEHYIKAFLGEVQHDVFITSPEQWGVIFTLRTGGPAFGRKVVTQRNKGGLLPSNLRVENGRVWRGEETMETLEECDFFNVIGMKWIEPENRL